MLVLQNRGRANATTLLKMLTRTFISTEGTELFYQFPTTALN